MIVGRSVDRINRFGVVPATDVEAALRDDPDVDDVSVIGLPEQGGEETVCAVVVPESAQHPPTLEGLRSFLEDRGMTRSYIPTRLELVPSLPRANLGKVQKKMLVDRLR